MDGEPSLENLVAYAESQVRLAPTSASRQMDRAELFDQDVRAVRTGSAPDAICPISETNLVQRSMRELIEQALGGRTLREIGHLNLQAVPGVSDRADVLRMPSSPPVGSTRSAALAAFQVHQALAGHDLVPEGDHAPPALTPSDLLEEVHVALLMNIAEQALIDHNLLPEGDPMTDEYERRSDLRSRVFEALWGKYPPQYQ